MVPLNQWVSQILSVRFAPLINMTTIISILVCRNELKPNHDKTEIVLNLSIKRTRPPFGDFIMGNTMLRTTANKAWE